MNIGIYGYGNLGRGAESEVNKNKDMNLVAIFTRRDPKTLETNSNVPVYSADDVLEFKNKIDVLIVCGGSAFDLPHQTPELAQHFNVVDSFDNHANIPQHLNNVDTAAKKSGHLGLISTGWDPGMFSINRLYANSILSDGSDYTFWGRGVSQGHSDAIRNIEGVQDARQYTNPNGRAVADVRAGNCPKLTDGDKHTRECYVVAKPGADKERIKDEIVNMPNYFKQYRTTVSFISQDELDQLHNRLPHGGMVIRNGHTGDGNKHTLEFKLTLDSNPEFTSSILLCFARAVKRMADRGITGAITPLDIAPVDLNIKPREELIATML